MSTVSASPRDAQFARFVAFLDDELLPTFDPEDGWLGVLEGIRFSAARTAGIPSVPPRYEHNPPSPHFPGTGARLVRLVEFLDEMIPNLDRGDSWRCSLQSIRNNAAVIAGLPLANWHLSPPGQGKDRKTQLGRVVSCLDAVIPTLDPDDAWRETLEIVRYNVARGAFPREEA